MKGYCFKVVFVKRAAALFVVAISATAAVVCAESDVEDQRSYKFLQGYVNVDKGSSFILNEQWAIYI